MDIASRLKAYRKDWGLTLDELADILGVSLTTVHRWEKGSNSPAGKRLRALEQFLSGPPPLEHAGGMRGELASAYRRMTPQHQDFITALTVELAAGRSVDDAVQSARSYMGLQDSRRKHHEALRGDKAPIDVRPMTDEDVAAALGRKAQDIAGRPPGRPRGRKGTG